MVVLWGVDIPCKRPKLKTIVVVLGIEEEDTMGHCTIEFPAATNPEDARAIEPNEPVLTTLRMNADIGNNVGEYA